MDDLTEVKQMNLKEDTEKLSEEMLMRPLQKHSRTDHKMKNHVKKKRMRRLAQYMNMQKQIILKLGVPILK